MSVPDGGRVSPLQQLPNRRLSPARRPHGNFVMESNSTLNLKLRSAVFSDNQGLLTHLVKIKVSLDTPDEQGVTCLHVAVTQEKLKAVTWLLNQGANVSAADVDGFDALAWGCIKGNVKIVTQLLEARADPEHLTKKGDRRALALCAERGHRGCMEELLRWRALVDSQCRDGATSLMCAAHCEEHAAVEFLLRHQANVNATDNDGWTPLMYAGNSSRSLEKPLSDDDEEDTRMGRRLNTSGLSRSASVSSLHKKKGPWRQNLQCLLQGRCDVNMENPEGRTAMMVAAGRNHVGFMQGILEVKCDVHLRSAKGQTALHAAASHGAEQAAICLLKVKADINVETNAKETPLMLAEKNGAQDLATLLTRNGAIVKAQPKKKGKKKK